MNQLTESELATLIYYMRNRLRYESRRPNRFNADGVNLQSERVWELSTIVDKLEEMKLAVRRQRRA